jgi:hypothetical protein
MVDTETGEITASQTPAAIKRAGRSVEQSEALSRRGKIDHLSPSEQSPVKLACGLFPGGRVCGEGPSPQQPLSSACWLGRPVDLSGKPTAFGFQRNSLPAHRSLDNVFKYNALKPTGRSTERTSFLKSRGKARVVPPEKRRTICDDSANSMRPGLGSAVC